MKIQPVTLLQPSEVADATWRAGFTKWLSFNQTQYARILMLDSDCTVLRSMDELFLTPPAPAALPRAYWLDDALSAQLVLVQPSIAAFQAIQDRMKIRQPNEYDMEIVNAVFGDECAILPHRPCNLLSGEFRKDNHTAYLGKVEAWDAERVTEEAKYVHFSDWPLPKLWLPAHPSLRRDTEPNCGVVAGLAGSGDEDCAERRIWRWLYDDFRQRRKVGCTFDCGEPCCMS